MVIRASGVAVTISSALLLAPRPAPACSPPYDPSINDPPCAFVQLYKPADQFPRQLHGSVRVGTFDRYGGNTISAQDTFDPNVQIFVHRATASGYEPVAFELVDQTGLVPNALQIQLADPVPGQYVVSSPQVTCMADPSPAGIGLHVGSFELEPDVSLPTSLGELHWLGEDSVEETYTVGTGGMCEIITVDVRVTHSTIELRLDAATLPWAKVIDTAKYVDGELYHGYSRLVSENGVATVDLTRICSSSDPAEVKPEAGVGDGLHRFKLVGKIDDLTTIESSEVTFSLSCEGAAADDDDHTWASGCAVGNHRSPAPPILVVFLALAVSRLRRRQPRSSRS